MDRMGSLDRPKLRPLSARRVEHRGRSFVALEDSLGLLSGPFLLPLDAFRHVARRFDGRTTLDEVRALVLGETGQDVSVAGLQSLVRQLDRGMVLEGPAFGSFREAYARLEVRPPALAGRSYPSTPATLRAGLDRHFADPGGSGPPSGRATADRRGLRANLCPHVDFERGGPVYSWAYRELVFLQHLFGGRRDFAIVPILVGSFRDLMARGGDPIDDPEVRRRVEVLRSAEAATGLEVAYIGGVDLCHVGPEFGDPGPVDDATLGEVRAFDRALLDRAVRADPAGWFEVAAGVGDRWRVCGLAATYTLLHAIGPATGRLLRYDQAVDPARTGCVTFASVAHESARGRATVADG